MHGCGNDYIYFDCFEQTVENPNELAKRISDRNFGIGGDGIILICPSKVADAKMRIFNADGSEGKMCGNGIRCVGKYLFDNGYVCKNEIFIETLSGVKHLKIVDKNPEHTQVMVDMGKVIFEPDKIPVRLKKDVIFDVPIEIEGETYKINCLSMGNPHCVVFCPNIESLNLEKIGPLFENNGLFPQKINTEFAEIDKSKKNALKMRVWERGSGETLACGTGACAAVVAATQNGYFGQGEKIEVKLLGGELAISYNVDGVVFMTGEAKKVFEGSIWV
jgi:diaminopimelate epimerase